MKKCGSCRGSGKCPSCSGTGIIIQGFLYKTETDCKACSGLGICKKCKGTGRVHSRSKISARVRCPKCGSLKDISTRQRPLQVDCNCGTTMILKK